MLDHPGGRITVECYDGVDRTTHTEATACCPGPRKVGGMLARCLASHPVYGGPVALAHAILVTVELGVGGSEAACAHWESLVEAAEGFLDAVASDEDEDDEEGYGDPELN